MNSGFPNKVFSGTDGQGPPPVQINLKKLQLSQFPLLPMTGIFLSNFQAGAFEILDLFFKQISDLLKKLWTFLYTPRGSEVKISHKPSKKY